MTRFNFPSVPCFSNFLLHKTFVVNKTEATNIWNTLPLQIVIVLSPTCPCNVLTILYVFGDFWHAVLLLCYKINWLIDWLVVWLFGSFVCWLKFLSGFLMKYIILNCTKFLYFRPQTLLGMLTVPQDKFQDMPMACSELETFSVTTSTTDAIFLMNAAAMKVIVVFYDVFLPRDAYATHTQSSASSPS